MHLFGSWGVRNPIYYERLKDGTHSYERLLDSKIISLKELEQCLKVSLTNPVLQPSFNLIARLFSSAKFLEVDKDGKPVENSKIVELLENPNIYQSQQDYLEQFIWFKYAYGYLYVYPVHPIGMRNAEKTSLYNLKTSLITYDNDFKTPILFKKSDKKKVLEQEFTYEDTDNDQTLDIEIGKIIPYYDLANGIGASNVLTAPSRLLSIKTEISNIDQAGTGKNKAIQTNGRELFSNKTSKAGTAMPLQPKEKEEMQRKLNIGYGLGSNRSRSLVVNASMEWQSLHIKLSELGLDDSRKADANTILGALGIPLDLFDDDTTYENQEQSLLGFMQNNIIPQMNDFTNSLTNYFELENTNIIGSYDHLPIMASIKEMQINTIKTKAEVLESLLRSGIDPQEALTLLEWSDLKLNKQNTE